MDGILGGGRGSGAGPDPVAYEIRKASFWIAKMWPCCERALSFTPLQCIRVHVHRNSVTIQATASMFNRLVEL